MAGEATGSDVVVHGAGPPPGLPPTEPVGTAKSCTEILAPPGGADGRNPGVGWDGNGNRNVESDDVCAKVTALGSVIQFSVPPGRKAGGVGTPGKLICQAETSPNDAGGLLTTRVMGDPDAGTGPS